MAFFNDISLGLYYPENSLIHNLDPRTKLIAVFMLMTAFLLSYKPLLLLSYVVLSAFIIVLSKLPLSLVFRNLRPFVWIFLLTLVVHLFWTPGRVFWSLPVLGIDLTVEGLFMGLVFSLRLVLLIIIAAVLTLTTSPIELTDALEKLFSPLSKLKVPIHEIVMMLTLSLRFIPTLLEEAQRLKNAQISRGASFEGNIVKKMKNVIPLILPLFISAFRRADDLALAMDSRCYAGGKNRTTFKQLSFGVHDYLTMTFCVSLLCATIWLGR
jgi:energy-coupling factor transport system permease protein